MTKASTTRKAPASRHSLASISNAAAATAAAPTNVTTLPLEPVNATEMLRVAALGIEQHTGTLDTARLSVAGHTSRSMASTVAAFNAIEGTSLTERQGWAFMQTLNLTRAANAASNGTYVPQHSLNVAAYAALGHEAASAEG